jgi:transcriptional antiterminator NusG
MTDTHKQIKDDDHKRYVLSVVSSQEHAVVQNLQERVKKQDLQDDVIDYLVPTVNQTFIKKNNEKTIKEKKLYPGYVFVKSRMNDKIWYVVRNTPGVRIIVGAETHPIPLTEKEYENIIRQVAEASERSEMVVPFKVDDMVVMKSGDFEGMS